MSRTAPRVPESTDLLCEQCGYVLNGLPVDGNCPECGKPIVESIGTHRTAPAWEQTRSHAQGFWETTVQVIVKPTQFFRTLDVRGSVESARRFARWHCFLAAIFFSVAATGHTYWYAFTIYSARLPKPYETALATIADFTVLTALTYFGLKLVTRFAARLTHWEATYRGYRMPVNVVLRGLYFHSAHYLPVAAAAATLVVGYLWLLNRHHVGIESATTYLYILSGLVVASAMYLFNTYWIGMRNMMYANR